MTGARAAITAGRFADYVAETREQWTANAMFARTAPNPVQKKTRRPQNTRGRRVTRRAGY